MKKRGRFAPTPSGRMHLGNAMCALLAWLSARSAGGEIVLRIEDLDMQRSRREYAEQLMKDLARLGLDWDEGGELGGPHEPYEQSKRYGIYDTYFEKLDGAGLVYPCFCSRAELHAASAPHASDGETVYPGTCRYLTNDELRRLSEKRKPAWRVIAEDRDISFADTVRGDCTGNPAKDCGDFLIRRSDGEYAYQLAVVVDDALMGINEVVRGGDLLSSAARQIYLYELLGLPVPKFAHIPMLLRADGLRLSKRDGSLDMGALFEIYSPEEIVGRLAFLCGITDRPEPAKPCELLGSFSWDKVRKDDIRLEQGLF